MRFQTGGNLDAQFSDYHIALLVRMAVLWKVLEAITTKMRIYELVKTNVCTGILSFLPCAHIHLSAFNYA